MDRVADIWGERTPHARGTVWPARVDLHLDTYIGLADRSEATLADSFRAIADGHAHVPDVFHTYELLAQFSDEHRRRLQPVIDPYGEQLSGDDVDEPERLHAAGLAASRPARQLSWLNTRLKAAAPQTLIVSPHRH